MGKKSKWKSLLRSIAPTIATAFGGPLAGMATKAASEALLGKPDGTEDELAAAFATADPAALGKLKDAEYKFKAEMKKYDIDLERIAADDRSSARQREMTLKDWAPSIIATITILGFFGILVELMINKNIPEEAHAPLQVMLGALGTAFISIINYYFGSSSGSAYKNILISNMLKEKSE